MAKKPSITTVSSGYQSTTTINNNTQNLRDAFDNTLSLDGSTPNAMQADFDMNSNDILNVDKLYLSGLYIDGQPVAPGTLNYNGVIKETQVATSGQTVFNLNTLVYKPGINNLSVYVDGVYQNPSTYTENTTSRITFSTGLHVGAIVDFVALSVNDLSGTTDATSVTYTPAGSGAVTTTVANKLKQTVSVKDFGAVGNGATNDTAAIQAAINASAIGDFAVAFPAGNYLVTGVLTGGDGLVLVGDGKGVSTITKGGVSGHILDILGTTTKNNISISGLTFDVANVDSAIVCEYVSNFTVENCSFLNMKLWGMHVGVQSAIDSVIRNDNVRIINCDFDTSSQTYEQVLVYNSSNVLVSGCDFRTGNSAIGIGIYQNLNGMIVDNCKFNIHIGAYYSISCDNITFSNCDFSSCSAGIQGANESDNGAFGATHTYNLIVDACRFIDNNVALQLGAVIGATVIGCTFYLNKEQPIIIDDGNTLTSVSPKNISIVSCIFQSNCTAVPSGIYKSGILILGFSGNVYLNIVGCNFEDEQPTPTQLFPVGFEGTFTFNDVNVVNSRLSSYSGAQSLGKSTTTTLGNNVWILDCQDVSASLAVGAKLRDNKGSWQTTANGTAKLTGTTDVIIQTEAGSSSSSVLRFSRSGSANYGQIVYYPNDTIEFSANGVSRGQWDTGGNWKPGADNTQALGTGSLRWSVVYAGTGTINTSDANEKQQVRELSTAEKAVAKKLKLLVRAFKFNDAVIQKTDNARTHVGVIAQDVEQAFKSEGLNATDYGVFCRDTWTGDDGKQHLRLGVRYEELFAFILGAL